MRMSVVMMIVVMMNRQTNYDCFVDSFHFHFHLRLHFHLHFHFHHHSLYLYFYHHSLYFHHHSCKCMVDRVCCCNWVNCFLRHISSYLVYDNHSSTYMYLNRLLFEGTVVYSFSIHIYSGLDTFEDIV